MSHTSFSTDVFKDLVLRDGTLFARVTRLSKTRTALPWSTTETRLHFPSCCRCTSEGCGNQVQTKCAKGRLGWVARLSNRVRCLKPFAILGRNNLLESPQQGSARAAKEITNHGPITESHWLLQHDLCYLNVMVAMMNLLSSRYGIKPCTLQS